MVRMFLKYLLPFLCALCFGYIYIYSVASKRLWFLFQTRIRMDPRATLEEEQRQIPTVTLFTTWIQKGSSLALKNKNTLKNWAQLKPHIQPVLFMSNVTHIPDLQSYGWDILPVERTAASGVPVLKHMFMKVMEKYNSSFFGYANGDILFDEQLIKTLQAAKRIFEKSYYSSSHPILITGKRTNVNEKHILFNISLSATAKKGKLFIPIAEDYFITSPFFPWTKIPNIVIGRPGYDNWIVLNSIKKNHTVIDGSNTILAVHQTTNAGNFEGHGHKNPHYNINLLGHLYRHINYFGGATNCIHWKSVLNESNIFIEKTTKRPKHC